MPSDKSGQKAGNLKDPAIAALFFTEDPDKLFDDLREIGHGSFGAVYYARNVNTNEAVAVKKMSYGGKQSLEKWQDIIKEVRFLTQIQHPNIVDYKGCYLKEHTAWLAMEYCIGSASDLVEVHKTSLEEAEISGIIHEAMQGLHYLHVHNKIHRDVKAGNILLTDQGHVKLADFGSASIASPANSFVGTPYWMAPEVILAMDEGQYDGKADIWSMGITSVELAERKPPLFNMNAMSALYHIAQNDPPVLNDPEDEESRPRRSWSQDFRNFVALLLQKVPDDRPTSNEVLQHPFMTKPRSATVVLELIERTKNVVRDLDNLQYRKMKKILIAETRQRQSNQTAAGATANSEGQMDEDRESLDGGSSRTNSLVSLQSNPSLVSIPGSSKSNSMNSLNDSHLSDTSSVNSQEGASSGISEQDVSTSHPSSLLTTSYSNHPTGSLQSLRPLATLRGGDKSDSSSTSSVTSLHQHQPPDQGATSGKGPTRGSRNQKDSRPPPGPVYHLQDTMSPETIQKRTQAVQLESSGFATIRSAQVIHRQLYEHNEDNRHREQLLGYKRMRQQHQKQLINYEQKLKNEMDEYSIKLIKELENLRSQYSQELERLIKRHQQDLEKEAKAVMSDDKKFQKHIGQQQDHEIKGFLLQQKKDYKSKKEQLKEDTNNLKASKDMKTDWLNRQISTLTSMHSRAESELRERHQQNLDLELRKYRRRALLARHNREQDLLREELNMKQKHKEKEHEVLLTQHDSTQLLEYKHLYAIQEQRMEHLKSQHQTELSNQVEYSQRRENELKRKHLAAMRQQPKSLKSKESQIKKQFQETVKVQEKQYRAWKNHVLETVPKKEQKDVLRRMKDEQMRKLAILAEQYNRSITELNQKQTGKLSDSQEKERNQLTVQLQQELELLTAYQSKVKKVTESQHDRELKDLEQKVSLRRAMLEQRMEEDTVQLETERSDRIRGLLEQQCHEIEMFDQESFRMGFSTVVITNYGDQVYVDQHGQGDEAAKPGHPQHPLHVSASTSVLPSSSSSGATQNIPRSSSGSNIRGSAINQQNDSSSHPTMPYAHRSARANSDVQNRSNSPAQFVHQRQYSSGNGAVSRPTSQKSNRASSANLNRNNSSRLSPGLQRRVLDPNDSMSSQSSNSGRSSPMLSQRVGNVVIDDNAPHMLQRVAANWQGERSQQSQRTAYRDERGSPIQRDVPHHGSMSSLIPPPSQYGPPIHHQRGRSGRSLDGSDTSSISPSNSYGLLSASSSGSGRNSPVRRVQTFADKSSAQTAYNGRNSPKMGTSAVLAPSGNVRYRQGPPMPPQAQQQPVNRMSGTSFSSSYH
ncbi:serine/threonine-protein kinase TAO1-like isoform X5 [Ciona intestinalis]